MSAIGGPAPTKRPPIASEPFRDPLDYIVMEHSRQSELCDWLSALAKVSDLDALAAKAPEVIAFLTNELRLHTEDEENDLFPMLQRRCDPHDAIDGVLRQLSAEHALDNDLVDFIVSDLEKIACGARLVNPLRLLINMRAFADTQRRHIAWENRVVLPLARRRLVASDIDELGRNMASRRGVCSPS